VESCIVRIYRRDTRRITKIEGALEKVGAKKRVAFHNVQELVAMLRGGTGAAGRDKQKLV